MTGGHWLVASGNPGKLKELRAMLAPRGVRLSSQTELGIPDAEEPWPSFVENALAKARHGARLSGLPTLADDSGLCVPALGGAPGVRSARFALDAITDPAEREALQAGGRARLDAENIRHLLARCQDVSAPVRAYFYSVVVWVASADDPRPLIAEGCGGARCWRSRGVKGASAMTRSSSPMATPVRQQSCRPTRRTPSATVIVRWCG